eukprot:1001327-Pleurochrysis_carterae.AAC.1
MAAIQVAHATAASVRWERPRRAGTNGGATVDILDARRRRRGRADASRMAAGMCVDVGRVHGGER